MLSEKTGGGGGTLRKITEGLGAGSGGRRVAFIHEGGQHIHDIELRGF